MVKNKALYYWERFSSATLNAILYAVFFFIFCHSASSALAGPAIPPPDIKPVYGIYANALDGLAGGWTTSVRLGSITSLSLINKEPVYQGVNSISLRISTAGDELILESPEPFDINEYEYLTFYARAATPGMLLGIKLLDQNGNQFDPQGDGLDLTEYGGIPPTDSWSVYNIPVTSFNSESTIIKGIVFKDLNGGEQAILPRPPIYIDEINFSGGRGEDIPLPNAPDQNVNQNRAPTPVLPFYPDINPWVWIIPGIIIALAVVFQ